MYENIFTATGFGGTGSSAITDILGEFSNGKSLGDLEIWFLQDQNAISDLEYHLIDGNHRSRVDKAIKNFYKYIKKEGGQYNKVFNNNFQKFSNDYIESLIDANFRKPLVKGDLDSNILNFLYFKIYYSAILKTRSFLLKNNFEFYPLSFFVRKYYSVPDRERFYKKTQEYTARLFDSIYSDNESYFLAIDQLVPANKIKRYFNYVSNLKVFLVDRDPRDLYLLNKRNWNNSAPYICDTSNVNQFITWFKTMRSEINIYKNIENVCFIQFEDLIYKYDDTLRKIYDFTGLSEDKHTLKFSKFNPDISRLNTKLWLNEKKYNSELIKIENDLSDFCFG